MIKDIFNTVVYEPIYNSLIFVLGFMPAANVGYAIIILTLVVRGVLFPFSHKSVVSQKKIQALDPEVKKIREKHTDKQEQAAKMMALYKEHGVSPFSGCLFLFIQLPIVFALYWVFGHGIVEGVDPALLYSFVQVPTAISFDFFTINLLEKSWILAILAGATQYFQIRLALPPTVKKEVQQKDVKLDFSEEFKNALAIQSRYILPVMIFIFSLQFPAAVALYWTTNNVFSIVHEYSVAQKAKALIRKA
jgi:YidC/Oxa1 family membrane protein insertase